MLFRSPIPGGTPGDQRWISIYLVLMMLTYRCRAIVDTPSGDLFLVQTSEVLQIKSLMCLC